jgi:hypothetical protein
MKEDKVIHATIGEWMRTGPQSVADGATAVVITDRSPFPTDDRITPEGAYGWQYGWRWLAEEEDVPCSRWTIPEAVYMHLPPTPYPEVEKTRKKGYGLMIRYPVREEAKAALDGAAFAWAVSQNSPPTIP